MADRHISWFKVAAVAVLLALAAVVVLVVRGSQQLPGEVQPIVWHRQTCAHCQMLIGEPAHAAQLITADGEVLAFDDPGCALRYLEERRPTLHRMWFHHGAEDRWLAREEVAFTTGGTTPMGFGLVAIERGAPGAIDLAAASERARGVSR